MRSRIFRRAVQHACLGDSGLSSSDELFSTREGYKERSVGGYLAYLGRRRRRDSSGWLVVQHRVSVRLSYEPLGCSSALPMRSGKDCSRAIAGSRETPERSSYTQREEQRETIPSVEAVNIFRKQLRQAYLNSMLADGLRQMTEFSVTCRRFPDARPSMPG